MGKVCKQPLVKLVAGFIGSDEELFARAEKALSSRFGEIDFHSAVLPFGFTDYYEEELGRDLRRKFIGFKRLISAAALADIKVFTNRLEQKLSPQGKRRINIDPGYLTQAKLVLASTKDFSHRILLNKGIFAEVTLIYSKNSFQPLDWTYPDYRTPDYLEIFRRLRQIYQTQLKINR